MMATSSPSCQHFFSHVNYDRNHPLDMKAGFPPLPKPIQGIPMLQSLIELLFHLCRCAQTQRYLASATMNLLFCAAPCNVYPLLTTEAHPDAFLPFLPEVLDMPNYTACVENNGCTTVRATHAQDKKTQVDIVKMNTALADIFFEAMLSQVALPSNSGASVSLISSLSTSYSGLSTSTIRQWPRIARQTGSAWPPIGTPLTGLMPSSFVLSPELCRPAARDSR
jgi:hypothetical protein